MTTDGRRVYFNGKMVPEAEAKVSIYDSALMFAALILLVIVLFFNLAARLLISRYEAKV